MEIVKPNESLLYIGFMDRDIERLTKVLERLDVELVDDELRTTNISELLFHILSNKEFRLSFIKVYQELYPKLKEELSSELDLSLNNYHSKWILFLLTLIYDDYSIHQLLSIEKNHPKTVNDLFESFFEMKRNDYQSINDVFNIIQKCNTIERTGWLDASVPTQHKESIAEHMFNMYHVANLYLERIKEIDKEKVLKMILVHDIAETIIGDISYPKKKQDDDMREDLQAKALFCAIMYYNDDPSYYNSWCEWEEKNTPESLIAHDIDSLQFNYQFMTYAVRYKECFDDAAIRLWMRRRPKTEIGLQLFDELIIKNPIFKERIDALNGK